MCLRQYGGTDLEVLQMTGPIITAICLALMRNALSLIRHMFSVPIHYVDSSSPYHPYLHGAWHPLERSVGSPIAALFLPLFLDIL